MRAALLLVALAACGGGAPAPATPTTPTTAKPATPAAPVAVNFDQLHGPIRSFAITGGEDIDYLRLQPLLNDEVGKPLDRARLRAKLDRAMEAQTLTDLTVSGEQLADGIKLLVKVVPQLKIVSIVMHDPVGTDLPLPAPVLAVKGTRLSPPELDSMITEIRDKYTNGGQVGFAAAWHLAPSGDGVAVTIDINPGEHLVIAARTYTGAKAVKKAELDKVLAKDAAVGAAWVPDEVDHAVLLLTGYYWDHGFAQVVIKASPQPPHNPATLDFQVSEGPIFHLGRIEMSGVSPADVKRFLAMMKLKQGALFNRTEIASGRQLVNDTLVKEGHAKANVVPLTKVDPDKHTISLSFEIDVGA